MKKLIEKRHKDQYCQKVASVLYDLGVKPTCSTFIDEDTITFGYGGMNFCGDYYFPLSNKDIYENFGALSWNQHFKKKIFDQEVYYEPIAYKTDDKEEIERIGKKYKVTEFKSFSECLLKNEEEEFWTSAINFKTLPEKEGQIKRKAYYIRKGYGLHTIIDFDPESNQYLLDIDGDSFWAKSVNVMVLSE